MKKLFLFLIGLSSILISCADDNSTPSRVLSDPSGIAYVNNEQDSTFTYDADYQVVHCLLSSQTEVYQSYKRVGGGTGIVGTWRYYVKNQYEKKCTFYPNGTILYHLEKTNGTVERETAYYSLYKNGDYFYVKIICGTREYNVKYMVSDNYIAVVTTGCPIL